MTAKLLVGESNCPIQVGPKPRPTPTRYREVLKQDTCSYCLRRSETLDHIVPRRNGGPNSWENLTGACEACNRNKSGLNLLTFLWSLNERQRKQRTQSITGIALRDKMLSLSLPSRGKRYTSGAERETPTTQPEAPRTSQLDHSIAVGTNQTETAA